jgi:glycosyltransferase involved in cell wall biosynthesis
MRALRTSVPPELSVVVPTHNRPAGLKAVLAALQAQTLAPGRFEVIVVDDGSASPAAVPDGDPHVRVLRHGHACGPGAARNTGWRAARAPLIAFTDDDCTPTPGWAEAVLEKAAEDPSDVVVLGPVQPTPEQAAELTPLSHTIRMDGPNQLFVTANVAYGRALLERLRGFDESFRRAAEDVDLGARATKAGARILFADSALVYHEVRQPSLLGLLRHTRTATDSVRALALHPELRELLPGRLFWKPSHPRLLLTICGLATRNVPMLAIAAAPYLQFQRRRYPGDSRAALRTLPVHLTVDLFEIATMLAGSIRHRTLML